MAIEDEVVGAVFRLGTTVMVDGAKLALQIAGYGAKALGVTYYVLAKKIAQKRERKEKLTGGEETFEKIMKSGEEIHAVWLNKSDLNNFSTIAKQLGVSFFSVQNGDELRKSKKFFTSKDKDLDQIINFSDDYSEMVSISYRASDEVRMAHILEMFDTYNPAQVRQQPVPEQTVGTEQEATPLDEVEKFLQENGVEVERPPEVIAYEEVKSKQERASEKNLQGSDKESSKEHLEIGDNELMCFEQFGFTEMPTQAEYEAAYKDFVEKNNIDISEPNYYTSLYEQGSKIIDGKIQPHKPEFTTISPDNALPECYQVLGITEAPKSLDDIKNAFKNFKGKNGSIIDVDKVGSVAYEAAVSFFNKNKEKQQSTTPLGKRLSTVPWGTSKQPSQKPAELPECFQTLGITEMPQTVQELKDKYFQFIEKNAEGMPEPEKVATRAYEACLKHMEKGDSVRTKLEAKRERNAITSAAEQPVEQVAAKTAEKAKQQFVQ
ncbi:MAG: hypothetical protein IJ168_02145 [Eubacterium sp.]|nr:hypothetical protein [Eubacterium sp.]